MPFSKRHSFATCVVCTIILSVLLVVMIINYSAILPLHRTFTLSNHNEQTLKTYTTNDTYGIVYTANSARFALLYVSISFLKYLKITQYNIEIFVNNDEHNDANTVTAKCIKLFENNPNFATYLNIKCIYLNTSQLQPEDIENNQHHYGYKLLSLLYSSFKHVLFIDADNILIQNPSIVFNSKEYIENQAIFFPDLWGVDCVHNFKVGKYFYRTTIGDDDIWDFIKDLNLSTYLNYNENDLKYNQSQESGQLFLNTVQYKNEINLVLQCTQSDEWQHFINGDKDCFRLMWLIQNSSFYFMPKQPTFLGFVNDDNLFWKQCIAQYWIDDSILFIHQTKWIEPMDHELWTYYLSMNNEWDCPILNEQWFVFPKNSKNNQSYEINLVDSNISKLQLKWYEFRKECNWTNGEDVGSGD